MKKTVFACLMLGLLVLVCATPSAEASLFSSDKAEAPQKADNVYDLIRNHKNLDRFADMISAADLQSLFKPTDTTITVFAPSNEAISDIPGPIMKRIKANKENLQSFVKYHIIVGSRVGTNALNGRKSSGASANGESIVFDGTNTKEAVKINDGHLVEADLQQGNNIVHVISAALIPASLKEAPAPEEKKEEPKPVIETPVVTAKPAAQVPAAPVATMAPVGTDAALPVSTSLPAANAKTSKTKAVSIGTSMPLGTATLAPVTTSAPVVPVVPPADTDTQKSKGFNFFGHHFGG